MVHLINRFLKVIIVKETYFYGLSKVLNEDNFKENEAEPSASEQSFLRKILREKLVTTQHELEVQQRDPSSPLYSVKSFEELNLRKDLLKGEE